MPTFMQEVNHVETYQAKDGLQKDRLELKAAGLLI